MPVELKVSVTGIEGWRLRFAKPELVREPMKKFLRKAGNVGRSDVRPRIPVRAGGVVLRRGKPSRPGRGRRSIRTRLRLNQFEVTVFSKLYYIRFLAAGTRRGIVARHMFSRSAKAVGSKIQPLTREMVREITSKLRGR